jgi:hypothetical protein
LAKQDRHNRLSVKPFPFIAIADRPELIRVKLANYGAGPMIIQDVSVSDGTKSLPTLLKWMPELPPQLDWSSVTSAMKGRSVLPEHEVILLELGGEVTDPVFVKVRDQCRRRMAKLTVTCTYSDIYEQPYDPYRRELDTFASPKPLSSTGNVAS